MLRICGGKYRQHRLLTPKGMSTRPTSGMLRETVFNICQHSVEGASFLDICAGSGAMGIEALSRGASFAVFIDQDRQAAQCIKSNLTQLELGEQSEVFNLDALKVLQKLIKRGQSFDLIYIDPPYGSQHKETEKLYAEQLLHEIDQGNLLAPGGTVFCEEAKGTHLENCIFSQLNCMKVRSVGRSQLVQWERK